MTDTDLLTVIREALRIGSVSHDGDPWFATDAGFGSSDEAGEKIAAGFAALDALAATPAPLMDIQKQSVVTTAPLDVPGHVHPGHILCAACVNNGMSAASAAERPATPNSYEKWIRPKIAATPAPLLAKVESSDQATLAALDVLYGFPKSYTEPEAAAWIAGVRATRTPMLTHGPKCEQSGAFTVHGPRCEQVVQVDATPAPLDVERLARAIDAIEARHVREGRGDRLTTRDNDELAVAIAAAYAEETS